MNLNVVIIHYAPVLLHQSLHVTLGLEFSFFSALFGHAVSDHWCFANRNLCSVHSDIVAY